MSSVTFIEIKFRTGIPQKQLYARVNTWLRFNDCVIVSEKEPTHIEAIYRGNVLGVDGEPAFGSMNQSEITALPQTVQTLNDPYSKEIHVKIHELDGESLLQIGVHQSEQRHGEKGLPYWGLKMDELGKLLDAETEGVDINLDFVLEKRLGLIKRNYLGIIGVSMILFLGLFGLQLDKILMYILVFFAPVTFFMGAEYGQIRGLQKESGKSSTDYHATA